MNLLLLENDKSITSHLVKPEDVVVCFNYLTYLSARKKLYCKEIHFIEELLSAEDYTDLQEATDVFTSLWYRTPDGDVSHYEGISYGDISRILSNKIYLTGVLVKYGEVIRLTVDQYGPSAVYCDFTDSENTFYFNPNDRGKFFSKTNLVNTVCQQLGLPISIIECKFPIPSGIISKYNPELIWKGSPKNLIIRLFVLFLEQTINKINKLRFNKKPRILIQNYPNLASLLRTKGAHLFINAISIRSFFDHFRTSLLSTSTSRTSLSTGDKAFLFALKEKSEKISNQLYIYNGIDYSMFYKRVAEQYIKFIIPNLISSKNELTNTLVKNRIKIMLDIESEGEMARLRCEVCNMYDINYVFVDHGIQGFIASSSMAQLANFNLRFLAGTYDPYQKSGNVFVTGSPCIDPYQTKRRHGLKKIRRVLFLSYEDNHFARLDRFAYREKYLSEIIPLFPILKKSGIEVIFRPHNENPDYFQYLFDYFKVESNCYQFSRFHTSTFEDIICTVDLLVCNVSSCFFEAQAAGVPTIFFEPNLVEGSLCLPYSGKNWDEVIRINNGEELRDIILRNMDDATELREFLGNFIIKQSEKYIGPMDGKASERIISFLIHNVK